MRISVQMLENFWEKKIETFFLRSNWDVNLFLNINLVIKDRISQYLLKQMLETIWVSNSNLSIWLILFWVDCIRHNYESLLRITQFKHYSWGAQRFKFGQFKFRLFKFWFLKQNSIIYFFFWIIFPSWL